MNEFVFCLVVVIIVLTVILHTVTHGGIRFMPPRSDRFYSLSKGNGVFSQTFGTDKGLLVWMVERKVGSREKSNARIFLLPGLCELPKIHGDSVPVTPGVWFRFVYKNYGSLESIEKADWIPAE
jgi:hypothetical protein